MSISKQEFEELVKGFKHRELFNYLGWDNDRSSAPPIGIEDLLFQPTIVADKNGFKVIVCAGAIPAYPIRMQLTNKLKVLFHEHILIFVDAAQEEQLWLYCYSSHSRRQKAEIRYCNSQDVERLYERAFGLFFELDEQDNITIFDVTARVRDNFSANAEKVTKKFYAEFKQKHTALIEFISGIEAQGDREWYASVMLNRLMFCYFMQRRGFLNHDQQYLRTKLAESQQKLGDGQFYSFYRSFLLVLFQKGFGATEHTPEITEMIGEIPYLNGGLFDLHEIERQNPSIDISDNAFESIFDLFDRYEWHLDARETAAGNEINPDVLGYIFEKYINDRAQMGAYYTQEDITDYIGRNTILPYLLEATKRQYDQPFASGGVVWTFLQDSGDSYIFESVKKGAELIELPDYVEIGIDTAAPDLLERRRRWNEVADSDYALPTEIWREVVERRNHYSEVKSSIKSGAITDTADLVTFNLNIVSFVLDLLDTIEDPRFIAEFYDQLESISILDPTCGSGAFLFAALNILEPLYDSLLSRMEDYLGHDYKGSLSPDIRRKFEKTLGQMTSSIHPSKSYFIYKSIILNNLYGVDIMREAVETAKLRLFLKLVSTADPDYSQDNLGIEPLPDIDFNVKSGNTLIGFANQGEIEDALNHNLFLGPQHRDEITAKMESISMATERFKQWQLGLGDYSSDDFKDAKQDLLERQEELRISLDKLLRDERYHDANEEDWKTKYAPFHWISEFYSIIADRGGFDVVIGNPPYVEYSKVRSLYILNDYFTIQSGNLYSFVIERSNAIIKNGGFCGMIIPLSAYCTERMATLQHIQEKNSDYQWISFYAERPSKLFDGVDRNLAVTITRASEDEHRIFSTAYNKWSSEGRATLFQNIVYYKSGYLDNINILPKIGDRIGLSILQKLQGIRKTIGHYTLKSSSHILYYRSTGGRYWKIITDFQPLFYLNGLQGSSSRESHLFFEDKIKLSVITAVLNSSLYYWYYKVNSNARDNNPSDLKRFPIDFEHFKESVIVLLAQFNQSLMLGYRVNSVTKTEQRSTGVVEFQRYKPKEMKSTIDEIDSLLAKQFDLSDEELDYIVNYDIKYRMGFNNSLGGDDD